MRRARAALLLGAVAAGAVGVGAVAPPAGAATIEVTTAADGGPGSLRDAFAQASIAVEPTEIVLQAGEAYTLDDCAAGDLAHTGAQPLTITGNGAIIRQTCPGERVIATDGDLTVLDTHVVGGRLAAGIGGGIEADTAAVTLVRSSVADNQAPTGGGIAAIRVTLVDSTVAGNVAGTSGGGIWADQVADLTNSTVAENEAGAGGGGIVVVNSSVRLLYATVAGNTAPTGANVEMQAGSDDLTTFASVIADPLGGPDCSIDPGAVTVSQGYNVASDGTCGFGGAPGDVAGGFDVELTPLVEAGGTPFRAPRPTSFLIDLVECDAAPVAVTADQRGVSRPQGQACDAGAVEVVPSPPPADTTPVPPAGPAPAAAAVAVRGPARFTG